VNTGLDWTTVTTEKLAGIAAIVNQEQQRVAVGLGNCHFISVRQVPYEVATMQRGMCGHAAQWPMTTGLHARTGPHDDAFTPLTPAPAPLLLLCRQLF